MLYKNVTLFYQEYYTTLTL